MMLYDIVKSGPRPHAKLAHGFLNLGAFVDDIIQESEVTVDAEVEVGAEVEVSICRPRRWAE